MAKMEKMVPFIIKWECGIEQLPNESNEALFERAKKSKFGFVDDPDDRGGATVLGVTIGTFISYCRKKAYPNPTVERLKGITYQVWMEILKSLYWDRWKADLIKNQSVAEILVDWVWGSGVHGIKIPQRILKVTDDGIVGVMTIDAVNKKDPESFFEEIRRARIDFYYAIVEKTASQEKFLKGWLNRANDFKFKEE